ncbi:hypothetical protein [Halobacillus yeomjeoni]|uniref:Uncharacterized protein n=1 Tax=Halobacillus yeomjeoni TaxID=311194 RepID=A0A931HXD5_9BACI|nr:hypothetical protein [Halobacillus yeomjeoni]MBH0231425.1 hypothetical protein [Halobacillus yeomjeoni]
MRQKLLKGSLWVAGVVVLTLSIFSYIYYYQDVQEEKKEWKSFVNHFYFSVERSIRSIDAMVEHKPQDEVLKEHIKRLNQELLKADVILEDGNYYVNDLITKTNYFQDLTLFLYGINLRGDIDAEVPPLAEDDRLDEQELKLLRTLKGHLSEAKREMYSKETGQENPDMTISAFNQIVERHLDRFPNEIYLDVYK